MSEDTKRCPFCGEIILAVARKCKHCDEYIDGTAMPNNQNYVVQIQPTVTGGKGKAITSMVCSLVGIVLFGFILGIIGVVFGVIAKRNMEASDNYDGWGMATAGIIIGILDIIFGAALFIYVTIYEFILLDFIFS